MWHPITVEKGKEVDNGNVELLFVTETSKKKDIKEGNNELYPVLEFGKEGKNVSTVIYKDIVMKKDIIEGKIIEEDKKFKYTKEEENSKIEKINNNKKDFKEFDINDKEGNINEYRGDLFNKNETLQDFIKNFINID